MPSFNDTIYCTSIWYLYLWITDDVYASLMFAYFTIVVTYAMFAYICRKKGW